MCSGYEHVTGIASVYVFPWLMCGIVVSVPRIPVVVCCLAFPLP
jgi:hypothetical protein